MSEISFLNDFYRIFWLFVIYAFIGWIMETTYASILEKRFINRGFLSGPFCPIYGFGFVILILVLEPLKDNILLLFIGSVVLTSILEYFTGYILETVFRNTWWDYSNEPFNLKGRICLKFSLLWGVLSVFFIRTVYPYTSLLIEYASDKNNAAMHTATHILLLYFIIDFAFVSSSVFGLNYKLKQLHLLSVELKAKVGNIKNTTKEKLSELENLLNERRQKYERLLSKRVFTHVRLINAFPRLKSIKFDDVLKELKRNIKINK